MRRASLISALMAAVVSASCALPFGAGESTSTSSGAATAFANDEPAYDFFLSKGLTNFQAAGIVGNLDQESGVDPSAVQAGGPGRGIAQWSVGGRWDTASGDNVVAYAAQQSESSTSLTLQLEFIWYELDTFPDYGLAALRATTDVTQATVAFQTDFEGCGACDQSNRIAYAEDVLSAYGSTPIPADAGADSGARDAASDGDSADGAPGQAIDSGSLGVSDDAGSTVHPGDPLATDRTDSSDGCNVSRRRERHDGGSWIFAAPLLALAVRRLRERGLRAD